MNGPNGSLRHVDVFSSLQGPQLEVLEAARRIQKYKPGEVLIHSGDESLGLHCVLKGTVKLESTDSAGKNHLIQMVTQGGVLGYRSLFTNAPCFSTALAVDQVEVAFIPKQTVMEAVERSPALAKAFLVRLSKDFREIETRLRHATSHTAAERVAEALLFLRENFQEQNWTRKEIGEWAGTTTETTIRTLAQFEGEGLIAQKGRAINIVNRRGLLLRARITV